MINTRQIAMELRLSHWEGIMRQRIDSGLSIKDFCETSGIHQNVYFYWQRKLREAACIEMMWGTQNEPDETASLVVSEGWTTTVEKVLSIEINGCRILAGMDTPPELLANACKTLFELC